MAERLAGSGGVTQWTNYLFAGSEMIGMRVDRSDATTYTRYFHKDHLGSIATITDETGAVVERLSYDAWGKRRFPNGQDDPTGSISSQTTRGFTGQEELADVGLVHMNGRVYDPLLGRFGTPDPTTESPFSTQGWNRYSYVGNSPLNFTDPSGYCFAGCFWQGPFKWLGGVFRRIPIIGQLVTITAGFICGPVCSTIVSAAVAGLASGNLGLALKAGLISAATAIAFYEVGSLTQGLPGAHADGTIDLGTEAHAFNIVAHAAVGCGSAVASGGKCGPAALAGATGSFATPLTNGLSFEDGLVVTTTAGGLASVAGGGKFGNGAVTAAFGYLYNHLGHMLVGTDAHYQLLKYLQGEYGDVWSGNTAFGGLFGDGRPDLIYDEMPREVYEIKPEGSEMAGATQLLGYLNTAGSQAIAGDFDLIFGGASSLTLSGGWFGEATYTYGPSAYSGVVTYTVNQTNVFDQALRLFSQRPTGGTLPLPPRMPPIAVPPIVVP